LYLETSSKTVVREAVELRPEMVEFLKKPVSPIRRRQAFLGKATYRTADAMVGGANVATDAQLRRGERRKERNNEACELAGPAEKKGRRPPHKVATRCSFAMVVNEGEATESLSGVNWIFIGLQWRSQSAISRVNRANGTRIGPHARKPFRLPNTPSGALESCSLAAADQSNG
jgi:hypothetical protein